MTAPGHPSRPRRNLDARFAVKSRQASNRLLVEERRKADRRKSYGRQYLAMLIGVMPEDRRQGERRTHPAAAFPSSDDAATDVNPAEEAAAN
jgi:hypothetical protein